MPPTVAIVVVNFNTGGYLQRCLASIETCLRPGDWEAVVIDNASSDDSASAVKRAGIPVRLVANAENIGFGRAVNQGVALTTAPLVLLLNPDCELRPGAVDRLVAELEAHARCAAVAPDVLNPDGTSQGNARGDPSMVTGLFGRSTLLTRVFPRLRVVQRNIVTPAQLPAGESSMVVDWVSGACMLVRREAFARVGGFDERFFLYWEDADLGRRLRRAGFDVRYAPGATVFHAIGRSSDTAQVVSVRAFHRSAYLYYRTWAAPGRLNPARGVARLLLGLRCEYYVRRAERLAARPGIRRRDPS